MQFNSTNLPQWQKDIINQYPAIYKAPNHNLQGWCPGDKYIELIETPGFCNLRYGFEFGEGWKDLVIEFSEMAYKILDEVKYKYPAAMKSGEFYIKSFIFKQKFGQLRWQGDSKLPEPFNKLFNTFIFYIEDKSLNVCEKTGKFGRMYGKGGFVQTLSDEHAKLLGFSKLDKNKFDF